MFFLREGIFILELLLGREVASWLSETDRWKYSVYRIVSTMKENSIKLVQT